MGIASVVVGCAKAPPVPECEALVALTDHLAHCAKLPAASQAKIAAVKAALDALLTHGVDDATAENVRKICRAQRDAVAESYAQSIPDCMK